MNGSPTLQPGVAVDVRVIVAGSTEIDQPGARVSESGELDLPLLRKVAVSDMTIDEAAEHLTRSYSRYFRDPQVVLRFSAGSDVAAISPWGYVTVSGKVKKPGRIAIPPTRDLTISKAILAAGGFAPSAQDKAVRVTRRREDGETERITVNLRAFLAGSTKEEDLVLRPGDVLYVPESLF